jgi:hypothetical protein
MASAALGPQMAVTKTLRKKNSTSDKNCPFKPVINSSINPAYVTNNSIKQPICPIPMINTMPMLSSCHPITNDIFHNTEVLNTNDFSPSSPTVSTIDAESPILVHHLPWQAICSNNTFSPPPLPSPIHHSSSESIVADQFPQLPPQFYWYCQEGGHLSTSPFQPVPDIPRVDHSY